LSPRWASCRHVLSVHLCHWTSPSGPPWHTSFHQRWCPASMLRRARSSASASWSSTTDGSAMVHRRVSLQNEDAVIARHELDALHLHVAAARRCCQSGTSMAWRL
jgi:hypothetical protein